MGVFTNHRIWTFSQGIDDVHLADLGLGRRWLSSKISKPGHPGESDYLQACGVFWTLDCVLGGATADQAPARKFSLLNQFVFALHPKVEALPRAWPVRLWRGLRNRAPQSQSNQNETETGREPHVGGHKSAHKQNYEKKKIRLTFFTVSK